MRAPLLKAARRVRGWTIVELMLVIGLLGTLVAVALPL